MKYKLLHNLGSFISLLIFAFSLWIIAHELRDFDYRDLFYYLAGLPKRRLIVALVLTVLSYWTMTTYDMVALRYIRRSLSYPKIALAAFSAYSISNTSGLAILTGGAIRYRLYTRWGLSAAEVAQITAFANLSFWLGLFAVGGAMFIFKPLVIPGFLGLPFVSVYPIGIIFLIFIGIYLLASAVTKRSLKIGKHDFPLPSLGLSLTQIATATVDWGFAGGVFFAILPPSADLSYPEFFGIYLLSQFAGIISNVPGGLGVFETVMLLLLSPTFSKATILGSLLAYRALYYLLPLGFAVSLLCWYEVRYQSSRSPLSLTNKRLATKKK
ncbi:MAG: UPF0104 family protein [Oscillatoria sp. SIO1A7]|nr:UPF0104 family protein [Oscillatoria sp. SIO1A7]